MNSFDDKEKDTAHSAADEVREGEVTLDKNVDESELPEVNEGTEPDDHDDDAREESADKAQERDDGDETGFSLRRLFASWRRSRAKDDDEVDEEPDEVDEEPDQRGRGEADSIEPDEPEEPAEEQESIADKVAELKNPKREKQALLDSLERWQSELAATLDEDVTCHVVELSAAHPTGLAQLYAGRPTKLSNLVREERALAHCRARSHELLIATRQMEERHGVGPTFLAIGTASWTETSEPVDEPEPAGDRKIHGDLQRLMAQQPTATKFSGPALLAPIVVDSDDDEIIFTLERTVRLWPELERALIECGQREPIERVLQACHTPRGFSPAAPLAPLADIASKHLAGFDVYESLTVGQFIHPGHVLVDDLQRIEALVESGELEKSNPDAYAMLCAMTGEESARHNERVSRLLPRPVEYDRDPEKEHGVGDLDPDQHNALDAVASGAHLLLNSPPGSERLTTVAAMVVDQALDGKTVAYVPGEKARATQLSAQLKQLGLDQMAVDLSSTSQWRVEAPQMLRDALDKAAPHGTAPRQAIHTMRQQLVKVRQYLGGYFHNLHTPSKEWGVSAYDALQVLTDLTSATPGPRTRVRLDRDVVSELAADGAEYARSLLGKAQRVGLFDDKAAVQPWLELNISNPDDVDGIVATVRDISIQILPQVRANISRTARETGLREATTVDQWVDQLEMLQDIRSSLDTFVPEVFEQSAADMVIATATPAWRKERSLHMRGSTRRRLIKQGKEMVRPGVHVEDLHAELVRIQEQRQIWREYSEGGGYPVVPAGMDQMIIVARQLTDALVRLRPYLPEDRRNVMATPIVDLVRMMDQLAQDEEGALALPSRVAVLAELRDLGLMELVDDIRHRRVDHDLIPAELDLAWWASALAHILAADPLLSRFNGEQIRALSAQLRALDAEQVESLAPQAAASFHTLQRQALDDDPQGASFLLHEVGGGLYSGLPSIYRQCPLAARLVPIRIVPPVMVPQICPGDQPIDVVILDGIEATPVAELIPTLARARQVVIIGDMRRQREGAVKEFASFLPHMTIPPTRSRVHGQVAKFLAEHGYGDNIMTVPVPRVTSTMTLDCVDGRGAQAPGETAIESSDEEVGRVVDMVMEAAVDHPDESLAVVALNARHAARIREELIARQVDNPQVDEFFSQMKTEPFVVVEADDCSSLRRDRIILSVGFAKTPHGRLLHDFGKISTPEGPSILVDALSTVRRHLQVVSAFDPQEVDPQRLGDDAGAHMLVDLLVAASAEDDIIRVSDVSTTTTEVDSAPDRLLVDLAERLFDRGLVVMSNVGSPVEMTIPLAIGHPEFPDEMLLAVLTDNKDFVSEKSLRRRERHWRSRLEDYGWNVHTVYSMSVFADPQGEAERIVSMILDIIDERKGITRPVAPVSADDDNPDTADVAQTPVDEPADSTATRHEDDHRGDGVDDDAAVDVSLSGGGDTDVDTYHDDEDDNTVMIDDTVLVDEAQQGDVEAPVADDAPADDAHTDTAEQPTVQHSSQDQPAPRQPLPQQTGPVPSQHGAPLSRITGDFANIVGAPSMPEPPAVDQQTRPPIATGLPLAAYTDDQLDELVGWLIATRNTRDEQQLVEQLRLDLQLPDDEQTDLVLRRSVTRCLDA